MQAGVNKVAAGTQFRVLMMADGTVWAWALNNSRQLGDTTKVSRRNPVPAPASTP